MKAKYWTVFFDENGKTQCGSDWAIPVTYNTKIHRPKNAVGYLILPDYAFQSYPYEKIEEIYKLYGIKL